MTTSIGSLAVSLSLDASNFNGSMSQVDRNLRVMGSELKAVKSLGTDYGKSLDGLKSKKDVLGRSVEAANIKLTETRKKYDEMVAGGKASEAQLERQAKKVNDAQAAYNRLETELKEVDAELKKQSSSWHQLSEKLTPVGAKLKSVGDGMKDIGKDLSLKVTAPLAAAGTASVKMAADFEAQMDRVGAIAGATAGEMNALTDSALKLGADTSKSASEVAIAMEDMAAMGFNAVEIIGAMPGVISASEASGESLAIAAQTVAAALNVWGLEAAEASRVADVLAMAANMSAAGIGDMQLAFKYAGAPAAALGIELEEVAAAIGIMTDAGLDGSSAGTALRASLLALNNPAKAQEKIMKELGFSILDADGNAKSLSEMVGDLSKSLEGETEAQKVATLAKLVGTEAVSGFLSLIKMGPENIDKMTESLENSAGASAETADKMKDNLKGALEELGGSIETAAIKIGNTLIPSIRKGAETVQGLVEKFTELSPVAQKTILGFAGIAAAAGPLLIIGGTLMSGLGSLVTTISAVSGAMAAAGGVSAVLGGALTVLTGPIGLTVAGLTALGIGAYAVSKEMKQASFESEVFGDEVSEAAQKAVGAYLDMNERATIALNQLSWSHQTVTQDIVDDLVSKYNDMKDQVVEKLNEQKEESLTSLKEMLANSTNMAEEEKNRLLEITQTSFDSRAQKIEDGQARIDEILRTAAEQNRQATESELAEINRIQSEWLNAGIALLSESEAEHLVIMERLKNESAKISAEQAAEVVKNSIDQKEKTVQAAEEAYNDQMKAAMLLRAEGTAEAIAAADEIIAEAERQKKEAVAQAESMHLDVVEQAKLQAHEHVDLVNWATGEILSKWDVFVNDTKLKFVEMGTSSSKAWKDFTTDISNDAQAFVNFISNKWDEMGNKLSKAGNEMRDSTKELIEKIKTDIISGWNKAQAFLEGIDLKQIGIDIIQGLITGITSKIEDIKKKAQEIANIIPNIFRRELDTHSPSKVTEKIGKDTGDGFTKGLTKSQKDAEAAAKKTAQAVAKNFKEAFDSATYKFKMGEIDTATHIKSLEDVRNTYAKTAEQVRKVNLAIIDVEKKHAKELETLQKEDFEGSKKWIDKKKYYNQLSLAEELAAWERVQARYEVGSKEREEAERNIYRIKKEVHDKVVALNVEYSNKMSEINKKLIEDEKKLNEEYQKTVDTRTKSLYSYAGIFDEVSLKDVSGQQLIDNLRGQVETFTDWSDNIRTLASKGINEGLLEELREMGPKAATEIAALNGLTDEQLKEYSNLWKEKNELARKQATTELEGLKSETAKKISELHSQSASQLESLRVEWSGKIKEVSTGTLSEFTAMNEGMVGIGEKTIENLIDGIESKESTLMDKIRSIANAVSGTLRGAFVSGSSYSSSSGSGGGYSGSNGDGRTTMIKSGSYDTATGDYQIVDRDGNVHKGKGSKDDYDKEYAKYHNGGWVGDMFRNLRFDEIPAILQEGEFVLSRRMIDNLAKLESQLESLMATSNGRNAGSAAIPTNMDNSRSYTTNIENHYHQPIESPSDLARKQQQQLRQARLDWGLT
ncbi:phage tail tape measure protein [bacterium LRH843]|nr:phage tail tape measure protein [bacterium LRH843]